MQKFFFDLLPVILFVTVYYMIDIYAATAAAIMSSGLQIVYLILRRKPVEKMYYFIFLTLLVLGGATLYFHNAEFIKWKPSIVNWGLAIAFVISEYVGSSSLIRKMLGSSLDLTDKQWRQVNFNFVGLFVVSGILNLIVAYTCSEELWVNFKLWGLTIINMGFMGVQIYFLRNHLIPLPNEDAKPDEASTSGDDPL